MSKERKKLLEQLRAPTYPETTHSYAEFTQLAARLDVISEALAILLEARTVLHDPNAPRGSTFL